MNLKQLKQQIYPCGNKSDQRNCRPSSRKIMPALLLRLNVNLAYTIRWWTLEPHVQSNPVATEERSEKSLLARTHDEYEETSDNSKMPNISTLGNWLEIDGNLSDINKTDKSGWGMEGRRNSTHHRLGVGQCNERLARSPTTGRTTFDADNRNEIWSKTSLVRESPFIIKNNAIKYLQQSTITLQPRQKTTNRSRIELQTT